GQVDEAERLLDAVERTSLAGGLMNALGEIAAIRAHTARLRYQLPLAIELSRQAAELTPAPSFSLRRAIALNYGIALWWSWEADAADRAFHEAVELAEAGGEYAAAVVALCHRARLRADQGLLDASWALFERAVALADRLGVSSLPSQSFVHLGMAYVLIERNELDDAERQLREALVLGEAGGKVDHVILSYLALSHIQRARGDLAGARRAARDAQAAFDRSPVAHVAAWVETNWVLLWLAEGDLSAAEGWAGDTITRIDGSAGWRAEVERMTLARVGLAQGRPGDALTALTPILDRSAETLSKGWITCRIDALAQAACVFEQQGRHSAALDALAEAVRLAEPPGHIRTFADKGPTLETLLSQLPASNGTSRDYIARLRAACVDAQPSDSARRSTNQSATPLSQRELEVLRHIHAGLSNREIAESLFVTVGTVKRHTNSIYSKLAVGSRTQ
ncbi:MAG: LuxR C-terminal-related transcriptional regulator, partial [Thermomicrobiales bacterium]